MKKASIVILAILLLASCQNEKKTSLSFGQVVLTDEGMVLPVKKNPDSEKPFWCMDLAFENQYAVLRSPKELSTCYITFAYDADGHQDMATVNLDFHSIQDGWYVYALPYNWFPPKAVVEKTIQTGVYYIPTDAEIPDKEFTDENGEKLTYPDFTGYYFLFNQDETQQFFKALTNHLQ